MLVVVACADLWLLLVVLVLDFDYLLFGCLCSYGDYCWVLGALCWLLVMISWVGVGFCCLGCGLIMLVRCVFRFVGLLALIV